MDFHSLSRRELQALCKKNKIPANITNVAMADALKDLDFVEGIEEILQPSESGTAKSSIESPQRSEIMSPSVPRTGRRTATRKTVKDEPETLQTLTRSRRTTRRMLDETPAEAAPTTRRRAAAAASVGRKIEMPAKESEEAQNETSAVTKTSRRRAVKENSSIKPVYSTRRSTRLKEKNVDEKESYEAIKMESFAKEMDEKLEINSISCEMTGVTDYNGFDQNASSENAEAVSVEKSVQSDIEDTEVCTKDEEVNSLEIEGEDEPGNDNNKADDAIEIKPKVDCEMIDEKDDQSGYIALEKEMKEYTNKDEVSQFVADEILESQFTEVEGAFCETVVQLELENGQISEENTKVDTVIDGGEAEDAMEEDELAGKLDGSLELESTPSEIEGHVEQETPDDNIKIVTAIEEETEDVSNVELDSMQIPDDNITVIEGEDKGHVEQGTPDDNVKIISAIEGEAKGHVELESIQIPDDNITVIEGEAEVVRKEDELTGEYLNDNAEQELDYMVVANQPSNKEAEDVKEAASDFKHNTEDVKEAASEAEPTIRPTCLTPVKSPLRTIKKSAGRTPKTDKRMTGVSDDKENIDSGRKEEKPKKTDFAVTNKKPLEGLSMRQLTKMFKEKLEITKLNKSKPDDIIKVATARPALRPLSENCQVEETHN